MTQLARFGGYCGECGVMYAPSTPIRLVDGKWAHEQCPEAETAPNGICDDCHMVIANNGSCECEEWA